MLVPRLLQLIYKALIIFTIIALACSCNQDKNTSNNLESSKTDSIQAWLSAAQSNQTSNETKSFFLEKAYKQSQKLTNDSLKNAYLTKLSFKYLKLKDSLRFRQVNKEAMFAASKVKDSTSLANLHWDLADFFEQESIRRDSSFYHYGRAEKIFSALGDKASSGTVLCEMAWVQNYIGDYTGSNITVTRAIKNLKPLNKFNGLKRCYFLLGDNAKFLNEYDRSLDYYNQSLIYHRKERGNPRRELSIKNSIGLVYQKKSDHQKAITYFSEVLSFDSLHIKEPRLCGKVINNLAYSYLKTDKINQLPMLFYQAIALQDSIGDMAGKTSSSHRLAEYYLYTKDTINAAVNLHVAKTNATQISDNKRLLEILRMYPRVDPKNETSYMQAYLSLNDSLQIQERQIRNKFARIQFETDEFIAENQLLARQKQLWTGIAAALLLLGLSTFIIVSQRIKNQKLQFKEQQQASNQEIFNLLLAQNEKVEEGKKLEQKRVSEELHDGVLGRMLGARMMLLGLNKKTDPEAINERSKAISMLQDVEGEVRSISHELSHAAYQKIHNFILSVEDLLKTVENTSKINIDFSYADDLDYDALNGDIKINLYRIIQESIQNAVKHADCQHINVSFGADAESLKIVIADDGKGFVIKKGKKGIGTRNITSRVKKVNGTWHVDSVIDKGTTVTLEIPIVANDNSTSIKIRQEDLQEF